MLDLLLRGVASRLLHIDNGCRTPDIDRRSSHTDLARRSQTVVCLNTDLSYGLVISSYIPSSPRLRRRRQVPVALVRPVVSACSLFLNREKRYQTCSFYVEYDDLTFEPPHDKTYKMDCAPSEDSDQPGHPPSLIGVFAVRSMGS